jgi:hypothetical protein
MCVHPSICPCVHVIQLGSHLMDFNEILYLSVSWKSAKNIRVLLQSDKNNGYLCEDLHIFMIISCWILRMRNVSGVLKKKLKKHIFCSVTFFLKIVLFMR